MSFISEVIMGKLREEMRKRVDEILEAGREWKEVAIKLTEALNRLSDTIERANAEDVRQVARSAKLLSKRTERLTKAFNDMNELLEEIKRK